MESETSLPEAQAEKTKPAQAPQVKQRHEEHKEEEAEWQLKGSDSTSSWHRICKVTKKTSSKTEESTKTYRIVGGKKILVDSSVNQGDSVKPERVDEDTTEKGDVELLKEGDEVCKADIALEKVDQTGDSVDKPSKVSKCDCCTCCARACSVM